MLFFVLILSVITAQSVELPQVFSSGYASLRYPDGWFAEGSGGQLAFANKQMALRNMEQDRFPLAGQVVGSITIVSDAMAQAAGIDPRNKLTAVLDGILALLSAESLLEDAERQPFVTDDKNGVYVVISVTQGRMKADAIFIITEEEDGYSVSIVLTGRGEMAKHQETILAIVGSVELCLPDEWPSIDLSLADSRRATVRYPGQWAAHNQIDGFITFASDSSLLNSADPIPDENQFLGQFMVLPDDALSPYFDVNQASQPLEILVALISGPRSVRIQQTQEFDVDGQAGAIAVVTLQNAQVSVDTLLVVLALNDGVAILTINTYPGQAINYRPVALAIISSLVIE